MSDTQTQTMPSDDIRVQLLNAALIHVPFEGWTDKALRLAVEDCELAQGSEALFFPAGANELIGFWAAQCDERARAALQQMDLASMKIRARVREGVIARFEAIGPHEEAARRAIAKLALPSAGGAGAKMLWQSADMIWRAIGDRSTDGNFYSKRAVLSAVLSSSLLAWLGDNSADKAAGRAFLDRRIENVMQFEKAKAKARGLSAQLPDPVQALSKLRFGRSGARRPYRSRY